MLSTRCRSSDSDSNAPRRFTKCAAKSKFKYAKTASGGGPEGSVTYSTGPRPAPGTSPSLNSEIRRRCSCSRTTSELFRLAASTSVSSWPGETEAPWTKLSGVAKVTFITKNAITQEPTHARDKRRTLILDKRIDITVPPPPCSLAVHAANANVHGALFVGRGAGRSSVHIHLDSRRRPTEVNSSLDVTTTPIAREAASMEVPSDWNYGDRGLVVTVPGRLTTVIAKTRIRSAPVHAISRHPPPTPPSRDRYHSPSDSTNFAIGTPKENARNSEKSTHQSRQRTSM